MTDIFYDWDSLEKDFLKKTVFWRDADQRMRGDLEAIYKQDLARTRNERRRFGIRVMDLGTRFGIVRENPNRLPPKLMRGEILRLVICRDGSVIAAVIAKTMMPHQSGPRNEGLTLSRDT